MAIVAGLAGAALVAGGTAYAANKQANAAEDAAETQGEGADAATQLQREMFRQTRRDLRPYRQAGRKGLSEIREGFQKGGVFQQGKPFKFDYTLDEFEADPGYQFRLQEGLKALERSAAAGGGLFSGATGKALQRYGQDYASGEYQKAYGREFNEALTQYQTGRDRNTELFNRYAALAGIGQTATTTTGQFAQQYGQQAGENILGAANAAAAGRVGQANAWGNFAGQASGALNQGLQAYMMGQYMQAPGGVQTQLPTYNWGGTNPYQQPTYNAYS